MKLNWIEIRTFKMYYIYYEIEFIWNFFFNNHYNLCSFNNFGLYFLNGLNG